MGEVKEDCSVWAPGGGQHVGPDAAGADRNPFPPSALEPDMEQQINSKLEKEYNKDVYCHLLI